MIPCSEGLLQIYEQDLILNWSVTCYILHGHEQMLRRLLSYSLHVMRIMRIHTHTPPSILTIILFSEQHVLLPSTKFISQTPISVTPSIVVIEQRHSI